MKFGTNVAWVILRKFRGGHKRDLSRDGCGGHFSKWPTSQQGYSLSHVIEESESIFQTFFRPNSMSFILKITYKDKKCLNVNILDVSMETATRF